MTNQASSVVAEACAWIAQLETGDLTRADIAAFREWVNRSPRHAAEVQRLARLSADLNLLSELEPALHEAAEHYRPVTKRRKNFVFDSQWWSKPAVSLISVCVLMFALFLVGQQSRDFSTQLATEVGAYIEKELPDGSLVKLNTNSAVEVEFNKQSRDLYLRRGEAYFEVAHDSDWPFVVHANGKVIRAVGTAFAVRLESDELQVTVTEGKVELTEEIRDQTGKNFAKQPSPEQATVKQIAPILKAGQRVTLFSSESLPSIAQISDDDMQRSLSWREGLFDFSNTPLSEVVREFERHSNLTIVIVDPALRERQFSGIFPTGNIADLLETLDKAYGIDVTYINSDTVELRPAPQA